MGIPRIPRKKTLHLRPIYGRRSRLEQRQGADGLVDHRSGKDQREE